jgi:hypothetical protein
MDEAKKRINIQPLPAAPTKAQKARVIKNEMDEEFPKLKVKAYTYKPSEKQMKNLKVAREAYSKKRAAIRAAELKNEVPVQSEVNSAAQQVYLSELDSLKAQIEEIKNEKKEMETIISQLKDIIVENKRDMRSGQVEKIKYPEQAGNVSYVSGRLWRF